MSEACSHSGSISCSCCSPLWKSFLPDTSIDVPESENSLFIETKLFRSALNKDGSPGKAILTLEDGLEVAVEAMGIHGGLVVATGSYQDVKAKMPKNTSEHQLSGKQTLLPGLIEPHVHIINTALVSAIGHDVSPFDEQRLRKNYNKNWVTSDLKAKAKPDKKRNGLLDLVPIPHYLLTEIRDLMLMTSITSRIHNRCSSSMLQCTWPISIIRRLSVLETIMQIKNSLFRQLMKTASLKK